MTPHYLILHHTDVSHEKNPDQFNATNNYHKAQKFPKSSLGFYCGYHYEIAKNGRVYQARRNDEIGAHTLGMNEDSIGIALDMNGDIEDPSSNQLFALRDLLKKLYKDLKLTPDSLYFHRTYANYKSCPGNRMNLCYIRNLTNS